MAFLPVAINLSERKVVIIGGGKVALQKVKTLQKYGAIIEVYGATVIESIRKIPLQWKEVEYTPALLQGADIVYCATDNYRLNRQIGEDARTVGALVNIVDDPLNCDFISPALYQFDEMSVACTSNAKNVRKSIVLRNKIKELLEEKFCND